MFQITTKKKNTASVKIPQKLIKKEAEKLARKQLQQEKQREAAAAKRARQKEKVQARAAAAVKRQEAWEQYWDEHLSAEVYGIGLIALGVGVYALLLSTGPLSDSVELLLRRAVGAGVWALGLGLLLAGVQVLRKRWRAMPALQLLGVLGTVATLLGLLNMALPLEESAAQSDRYGGSIGFAMGYFLRSLFGDVFAVVILLGLLWVFLTLGFGLRVRHILALFQRTPAAIPGAKVINSGDNPRTPITSSGPVVQPHLTEQKQRPEILSAATDRLDAKPPAPPTPPAVPTSDLPPAELNPRQIPFIPLNREILYNDHSTIVADEAALQQLADRIVQKLEQFGLEVTVRSIYVGPTVTQFALEPAPGVKISKIAGLKRDLSLALAATTMRIEAPIPGKSLVGIEIPNAERANVGFREIIESKAWAQQKSKLKLAMGRDAQGKAVVADLSKMPHLMIAGKTGSGKSVGMNAFLCSLLWNNSPSELKLILVDPKRVELKPYDKIPHLLTPVITEPDKATSALAWAVAEMNRRYKLMEESGVRDLKSYNQKYKETPEPYIVIVIDELADLMMVAGKDVEAAVCRIAQMARAVGMHLMIATQRPSVDVVTGLIKANLPARIAFKVSSGIDSRTIIDQIGAEDLLGFGDMLYLNGNDGSLTRIQGLWIRDEEIERIVNNVKLNYPEVARVDEITEHKIDGMAKGGVLTAGIEPLSDEDTDDLYDKAVALVLQYNKASASMLQRLLEVGYARAARILDQMEERGVIGPARGAKPREIFLQSAENDGW
ncbi:DNA translocase FtsK 4TM domain-containing protein [Candidatus Peribacteria bacterium]|nr:DNA translocase FtsK 4TM domain-containing protein [Candidatus Peribacteria bacterium]